MNIDIDYINSLSHNSKAMALYLMAFANMPKSERDRMLSNMKDIIDAKKKWIEEGEYRLSAIRKQDDQEQTL